MINNKRGLSTVVTTLIIILLVLVAIGIIWIVIRGVIETGGEEIDFRTKCLNVDVRATKVDLVVTGTNATANVTLERKGGSEEFTGVKLVFQNTTTKVSGTVNTTVGNIPLLSTKTILNVDTGIASANRPNKVDVIPYFTDSSGSDYICTTPTEFNF